MAVGIFHAEEELAKLLLQIFVRVHACRVYRLSMDLLEKFQGLRPRVTRKTEHTVPTPGGGRPRNILAGPVPWRDVAFDILRAAEPYNSLMR